MKMKLMMGKGGFASKWIKQHQVRANWKQLFGKKPEHSNIIPAWSTGINNKRVAKETSETSKIKSQAKYSQGPTLRAILLYLQ